MFLKRGVHNVNWAQLICQNPQHHAIKICIRVTVVVRHANLRKTSSRKANMRRRWLTDGEVLVLTQNWYA
jgi:hypothetical protein